MNDQYNLLLFGPDSALLSSAPKPQKRRILLVDDELTRYS